LRVATLDDKPWMDELIRSEWANVSDDYSDIDNIYFDPSRMISYIDDGFMATFVPITHVMADVHIISNRDDTFNKSIETLERLKAETPIRSLIAHIPFYNERVKAFAEKMFFRYLGINPRSFLKNGELIDQYVYTRCL